MSTGNEFWVIEFLNNEGNMIGYLANIIRAEGGGIDTYWTANIHKALQYSNATSAQTDLDGAIDHAIGDLSKFCKVREHAWILSAGNSLREGVGGEL